MIIKIVDKSGKVKYEADEPDKSREYLHRLQRDVIERDTGEPHDLVILDPTPEQKIDRNVVVNKTITEMVADGTITPEEAKNRERAILMGRLAELDRIIPRCVEDLYTATGKTPYTAIKAVIVEKEEIRGKL